jgi:hypothetical protein
MSNNKIISDNSDCETIDEDKKYKSIENEKDDKDIIHSNTIDKPIQKCEIHITSNIKTSPRTCYSTIQVPELVTILKSNSNIKDLHHLTQTD